jgi:hypothetical protein
MKTSKYCITRREFLQQGVGGAGLLAVGTALGAGKDVNPFAYDVARVSKTDPKLIHFEQAARFAGLNPEPRRIAVGPEDRVYVAGKNGVTVLDREGAHLNDITLTGAARCVAVAADGTVYAGVRDHVEVFDRKAQRIGTWESPGKKTWFSGMAAGENDVFVADAGNRVVLRYDRSGKLAGRIGEKNKERNIPGLIVPSPYLDVELGKDGLLRVNNPGRHRVEAYTLNGDLELFWGKPSAGIEGFCGCCNPVGLAMLSDGRYVTCEKGLPRVKIYSAEGKFDCVVAGPESFPENTRAHSLADCTVGGVDAAADSQGRIYVLDLIVGDVRVMRSKA